MRLFVDYTNWKGKREWREIEPEFDREYLRIEQGVHHHYDEDISEETLVIHCRMVDRGGARRTLKLTDIHGFKIEL